MKTRQDLAIALIDRGIATALTADAYADILIQWCGTPEDALAAEARHE